MKIGLLHISDIHIGKTDKNILEFIPKIQSACHFEFNDITKLYVVITGDIANTGNDATHGLFGADSHGHHQQYTDYDYNQIEETESKDCRYDGRRDYLFVDPYRQHGIGMDYMFEFIAGNF